MAKIINIQDFLKEKGEKELNKVLSDFIVITEKFDAHRFSFERTGNSINFYGKKQNKQLSLIDRAISDLYEPAINYILSLDKNSIPENIRFGCYFISPKFFLNTEYKKRPKNNLILSDLKTNDVITITPKKINHYAEKFGMSPSNNLAIGKISEKTKLKLIEFARDEEWDYKEALFNMFPKFFPLLSKQTDEQPTFEGVIIRSDYRKYTYIQINDINFKEPILKTNSNIFELLLIDILDFMKSLNFMNIKCDSNNSEIRYLEFISEAFNKFVGKNKLSLKQNNISKPEFLSKSGDLSTRYFSNKKTLELIKDETFNYILRVFITTFNNERKPRGIIDTNLANEFNEIRKKILNYISKDNVIDFMQFKEYIK